MLTVFWDYKGIIHQQYMVKGTRINSKTYVKTQKSLKQSHSSGKKPMLLQYYNSRAHTSVATLVAINSIRLRFYHTLLGC